MENNWKEKGHVGKKKPKENLKGGSGGACVKIVMKKYHYWYGAVCAGENKKRESNSQRLREQQKNWNKKHQKVEEKNPKIWAWRG